MASIAASTISISARSRLPQQGQAAAGIFGQKSISFSGQMKGFKSLQLQPAAPCLQIFCAAKPETVQKVCEIVRTQLALPEDSPVTGKSKFSQLGADSLDTVEIVMGLEEAFDISVEEESAQSIGTVQDAADLIEKLVESKSG